MYPKLGNLLFPTRLSDRRLLLIHDLSVQPFSIGDILVMQEASLVLREKYHLGLVDFALVYDPKSPASLDPAFAHITEKNYMYALAGILPVAQVNQYLGSLFLFNSHLHLQRFIVERTDLYHVWPPVWKMAAQEYLYYTVVNDLLYDFYREHKWIPHLTCRPFLVDWAKAFYREHTSPHVPVTVNIRNNKAFGGHRNTRLESWLEFFKDCEERYPVKFIIICSWAEVDERLRQCPNVIIAKDYHTGIEQDLALIYTAAMHMGAPSGPAQIAIFGIKPYLITNADLVLDLHRCIIQEGKFLRYSFAGPMQRFAVGPCTTELLTLEFARMWAATGLENLRTPENDGVMQKSELFTWLR